jgi:hypothetical protein|uniref:Uncharacterized protein n=1 Tax=Myoviridae sp. ctshb19 TaxID=2825194 RepID=A0A8S5UG30_9CAUD|nr:MAG TPA: hypothetical protein [Myoviridae sp. ctshb19]
MHINPFVVASSLVQKMASYNVEYNITSGSLLGDLPKGSPTCVQLEVMTKKGRVVIRIFSTCQVEVEHLENKSSKELWTVMEIFLKTIIGPPSAGLITHKE